MVVRTRLEWCPVLFCPLGKLRKVMTTRHNVPSRALDAFVAAILATSCLRMEAQTVKLPTDPGVRSGAAGAGGPLPGLTADETAFFRDGLARFADIEAVTGGNNNGL